MTHRRHRPRTRRGFALPAVLAVIAGLTALALTGRVVARNTLLSAENRIALTRARWTAEGCAERIDAALGDVLVEGDSTISVWSALDRAIASASATVNCNITTQPSGTELDLNTASAETLHALFDYCGIAPSRADSLTDALLDWRD